MKFQKLVLVAFLCFGVLVSCNNDDDNNEEDTNQHAIHGSWNLNNVTGGFVGIDIDYTIGEVIWTFQETNNQLVVENNIITTGPEDIYAGLDTGIYTYEIEEEAGIERLFIDTFDRGTFIILDDTLTIDDNIAADGLLTTFIR